MVQLRLRCRAARTGDATDKVLSEAYAAFLAPHREWLRSAGIRRVTFVTPNARQEALTKQLQHRGEDVDEVPVRPLQSPLHQPLS